MAGWPVGHPALVQHDFHDPPAIFSKEYDTQMVNFECCTTCGYGVRDIYLGLKPTDKVVC